MHSFVEGSHRTSFFPRSRSVGGPRSNNAHRSKLLAHLRDSYVLELLLLRHVRRVRVMHGAIQGREHAVAGRWQDPDRICAALLLDTDGDRQDLSGKKRKSDRAWAADPHWNYPNYSQLAGNALLPALAVLCTQVGGDPL